MVRSVDSPYYRAAKYTYNFYRNQPQWMKKPYTAPQRLQGVRDAIKYALMEEKDPLRLAQLNEEFEQIGSWIKECDFEYEKALNEKKVRRHGGGSIRRRIRNL